MTGRCGPQTIVQPAPCNNCILRSTLPTTAKYSVSQLSLYSPTPLTPLPGKGPPGPSKHGPHTNEEKWISFIPFRGCLILPQTNLFRFVFTVYFGSKNNPSTPKENPVTFVFANDDLDFDLWLLSIKPSPQQPKMFKTNEEREITRVWPEQGCHKRYQ